MITDQDQSLIEFSVINAPALEVIVKLLPCGEYIHRVDYRGTTCYCSLEPGYIKTSMFSKPELPTVGYACTVTYRTAMYCTIYIAK